MTIRIRSLNGAGFDAFLFFLFLLRVLCGYMDCLSCRVCVWHPRRRFLQEDDDSMSTSLQEPSYSSKTSSKATTSKRSSYSASISTASQKKLSSASAVTAAAAALLASSKLQKSSRAAATKKSKGKKKKQTAATAHFSDSEGSPPSYSSQRGSRNDPECVVLLFQSGYGVIRCGFFLLTFLVLSSSGTGWIRTRSTWIRRSI